MNRKQNTAVIIGGAEVAALVFQALVLLFILGCRNTGFWMMGPGMMEGYGAMFLLPLLFIVIIGLAVWAVVASTQKNSDRPGTTDNQADSPLDILKRRYALGEIEKEEYETKKGASPNFIGFVRSLDKMVF